MNMFKITAEIRSLLLQNEEIKGFVGERVFPIMAPEDTVGDFIVYQRDELKAGIYEDGCSHPGIRSLSDCRQRNPM